MIIESKLKRRGNSLSIIIPKEIVESRKLKEGDSIFINIVNKADLSEVFGTLKRKRTGQEFKELVR